MTAVFIHAHPDDEAIARVILNGGADRRIWFNYRTEKTAKWESSSLQRQYGYRASMPPAGSASVVVPVSPSPLL